MADDERIIETRDPSFWNPCADSEWAYVGVPLSRCEAASGPREVKKIDCTGVLSESVQALFQEIAKVFVEDEEFNTGGRRHDDILKRFNERATEAINHAVCLGSGKRPSFLMRERMRWLVKLGTYRFSGVLRSDPYLLSQLYGDNSFQVLFDDCEDEADELVTYLEESNRPHDKALLYILLGKWIKELRFPLRRMFFPAPHGAWRVLKNKLQCATRQRALLSCFYAFDAGAEDWCFGVYFRSVDTAKTCLSKFVADENDQLVLTTLSHPSLLDSPRLLRLARTCVG